MKDKKGRPHAGGGEEHRRTVRKPEDVSEKNAPRASDARRRKKGTPAKRTGDLKGR